MKLSSIRIGRIVRGETKFPAATLGIHKQTDGAQKGWAIRHFAPHAKSVIVRNLNTDDEIPMRRLDDEGFFEAVLEGLDDEFDYELIIVTRAGKRTSIKDPYHHRFGSLITKDDRYLFGKGDHHRIYEKLGARLMTNDGIAGVNFALWAPNAKSVAVTGVFNGWHLRSHPMQFRDGLWELFIPGLKPGAMYKFVVKTARGKTYVKADPYSYYSQLRPKKSSVVWNIDGYTWSDQKWIAERNEAKNGPMSVYEVHLGSWIRKADSENPFYNYREIAEDLVPYVKDLGFTHIELMPVMEHPLDQSWGYQVTSYFAPTSRFGRPDDFMYFVDHCHQHGIGVIIDWVPAHFPRDPHGLGLFDGTSLYEHSDPRKGYHPDWKTNIFNYGRHEVKNFLVSNALFWIEKYHVDGIRVDAVASMLYLDYSRKPGRWIPNKYGGNENLEAIEFIRAFNSLVAKYYPGVMTIAEESTAFSGVTRPVDKGGLGFTYKWNMGWMHDTLEYLKKDPVHRKFHQNKLTFMLHYAFNERFVLVLSHDEVVHGKRSLIRKMAGDRLRRGDDDDRVKRFSNLRLLYGFMFAHPGKKTLFMGGEFAQFREWSESRELDWYLLDYEANRKIQDYVRDLNALYASASPMHFREHDSRNFEWIDNSDTENSCISFLRRGDRGEILVFVFNFTPAPRPGYRIGVPEPGYYREVLNSDAEVYGGSNAGNFPGRASVPGTLHYREHSIELDLPPLSMTVFRHER